MTNEAAPVTILNPEDLEARLDAAATISETMRVLQKSDSNLVAEILETSEGFTVWEHLPDGDVYDRESHGQYYYHAHPKEEAAPSIHDDEHGHFHLFLRGPGMGDARPDPDNSEIPDDPADIAAHLIGIGMDAMGRPIRLFTTNRWVTGEVWFPADEVINFLDRFVIDRSKPSWPLNLWISAMVRLYRPQIVALLRERDAAVAAWRLAHPDADVFEDRALEVTSSLEINLEADVDALIALAT
ncbi:MAG: hypothetical protein AAFX52_06040 [Pseudomonadota bacterium]